MKTSILAALAALTITANAQVHVVTVDGWAVSQNQQDHFGPDNWEGYSLSFKPSLFGGGLIWGWWGYGGTEFTHHDARRIDFVVVEYDGGCLSSGTQVYAERWNGQLWYTPTAPTPAIGKAWAAYRIDVSGGSPSVALVASGSGDAPWQPSYFEKFLTAL